MKRMLITTALGALFASSAQFASSALAAAPDVPYAMRAVHADFEAQLTAVASEPGELGLAARDAARLFEAQNARQAALVLPLVAAGGATARPPETVQSFERALPALLQGEDRVVVALSELYAAADLAEKPAVAMLAERMIWHQTNDLEVLYPQAMRVSTEAAGPPVVCAAMRAAPAPGPLYGTHLIPLMGVGDPHAVK